MFFAIQFLCNISKNEYIKIIDIASVTLINLILIWNVITLTFYLTKRIKNSSK